MFSSNIACSRNSDFIFKDLGRARASGVDKHKIARDSSNAERMSRQRVGKLDRPEQAYERQRQRRATEQAARRQARQEQDRESPERLRRTTEQARRSEPNQTSLPSLEQQWVQSKLHSKLATIAFCHCSSSNKSFPSIKVTKACVSFVCATNNPQVVLL